MRKTDRSGKIGRSWWRRESRRSMLGDLERFGDLEGMLWREGEKKGEVDEGG